MHRLFGALIGFLALTAAAYAAEPPAPVVEGARALLSEDAFNASFKTGKGFYRNVDVNGDGKKDWIADFMQAQAPAYCGTGGCPLRIWVFDPGDQSWRLEVDRQTLGYSLPRRGELNIEVHGVYCGGTGSDSCRLHYTWDPASKTFMQKADKDGALIDVWPPRPVRENEAPAAVWSQQAAFSSACVIRGGKPDVEQSLIPIPDVNGDGVRDWVFDGNAAYCATPEGDQIMPPCDGGECGLDVFITDPAAEFGARRVYHGEDFWRIAFHKNAPADFMILPYDAVCGGPKEKPCVYQKAALTPGR